MINIVLGKKGFISSSIKDIFNKNKIKSKFFGKNEINFLKKNSINLFKTKTKNLKKFNLIIISAVAPAKNILDYEKNIIIIKNIISSVSYKKINKIIYISSDAVYSDTKKEIFETSKTEPNSIHGLMHLHRENLLNLFFNKKLIILRPTLLFGKNDPHNSYGPNSFIRIAKNKKNITLFGKGEEKRDHLFINDLSFVVYKIVINKNIKNGAYNAASGALISFYDIAKLVQKKYKTSKILTKKRTGPMPHLGFRKLSNKKIKNFLNNYTFSKIEQKIDTY